MEGTYVTLANMSIGPTVPLNGQETGSAFGSGASAGGSVGVAATKVVKPQRPRRKEEANIVDDGICDGTFLLAVRYIGSVVDNIDGGGKKVTGDISWGKSRRGEGEQNDNNKNNQNMLVDDETICRYFSKYLIMRATCHHPG